MAQKYYAVKRGWTPGIYDDWDSAKKQILAFRGSDYKSFLILDDAIAWMKRPLRTPIMTLKEIQELSDSQKPIENPVENQE